MHWLAVLILLANLSLPIFTSLQRQENAQIKDLGVEYSFGGKITFRAQIQSNSAVKEAQVFITPEGQPTVWEEMSLEDEGEAVQEIDSLQLVLTPFTKVEYHYEAILANGQSVTSPIFDFSYDDNRFEWKKASNDLFEVNWYGDDSTLGQEILNISERGLEQAQKLLDVSPPKSLHIYAYTSSADLQTALQMTDQPWIAGHTAPEMSMILISVPSGPEQKLELERQIPHEIMHVLQYELVGEDFQQQPVWLMEGMASLAELYPNPEYQRVLEATKDPQEILPIQSLCASFPREAAGAFFAYAESESFTRFLHDKYGKTGLRSLIDQYENGIGCEEGISAALGASLSELEYRWRQEALGVNAGGLALSNLTPYLLMGLILIIPAALAIIPFSKKPALGEKQS